jgi:phospholipid/cholesterol/gamma-HCH transport system substrate-binding protein
MSGRTALQIRRYGRYFLILIALVIVGTACGFYILLQQRLPNPFQSFYKVNGAFSSAAAVVPGLGEPVNVAGVHVGEILDTTLVNGHGIIHMEIDPGKMPRLYNNAHADLVPNTPLMDMQVNIDPGTPPAGVLPAGGTIKVGMTTTPTAADDLLDALDTDTRTWFTSLITELNNGTQGRGQDLRKLLMNLGPTAQQLRTVGDLLAGRRGELAALVHNLGLLTQATSAKDTQIQQVIGAGNTTIQALATQDVALRAAIQKLPGTLQTTRQTLSDLTPFANALGPTATALIPTAQKLPSTLRDASTVVRGAALLPLDKVPAFEAAVLPLAGELGPISTSLTKALPPLTRSFRVLNYIANEIAYNAGGRGQVKNPGFLYWLAWFAHNADSFLSTSDANGPVWRTLILTDCASLKGFSFGPLLETLLGTTLGC